MNLWKGQFVMDAYCSELVWGTLHGSAALNDTGMSNKQELKWVFGKPRAFPSEALQLSTSSHVPTAQVSPSILHPVPHPAPLLCLKESLLRVQALLQHPHPTFISLSKA